MKFLVYVLVGVIGLALIGIGGWWVWNNTTISSYVMGNQLVQQFVPVEDQNTNAFVYEPKGYLLLNLDRDTEGNKGLFIYNMVTKTLQESPLGHYWPKESHDGMIGIGSKVFRENGQVQSGLFSLKDGRETLVYASSTYQTLFFDPAISPSGTQYTFLLSPDPTELSSREQQYEPGQWKLYHGVIGSNEEPRHIANGTSALFSPDETKILYVGDDGFHLYDLASGIDTPVPQIEVEVDEKLSYIMTDLSLDGRTLVMTNSQTKEVKVGTITSWEPFTIEWTQIYPILAYWPAISPDGNYLALQQFQWRDGHPGDRRIAVIDLRSQQLYEVEGLEEYTASDFYISEWGAE